MHAIDTTDGRIAALLDVRDAPGERDGTDIVVRLKDGRGFSLPVLTLRHVERQLARAPSFARTGALVVKALSAEAIAHAVSAALDLGIERFGALEAPLEE
ncbi:hypothetical protein P2318_07640 [Myxococcaceae bacterium GXIMD 01537]